MATRRATSAVARRPRSYHRLDVRSKERYARDRLREPAIACPACETQTTVRGLVQHLDERCPGRRPPHHLSEWVTWDEAMGVANPAGFHGSQVGDWIRDGLVRTRDDGPARRYLLRDLVQVIAVRLVVSWR